MGNIFYGIEPSVYKSQINVPYQWWAGETASKFFMVLRDDKKILGKQCPRCGKVYCPPKKTCPSCFTETNSWKEVGPKGKLISYTIVLRQLAALQKKVPVAFGLICIDGADNAMLHYIGDVDVNNITIGMEVEAVFADGRNATINAISHFKPLT